MRVIYDLEAFGYSPHGGIARLFREVIERLMQHDDFFADLHVPWRAAAELPKGERAKLHHWKRLPDILDRHASIQALYHRVERLYWNRPGRLFHPTGYPSPECALYRLPTAITIHDLTHEHIEAADNIPDREAYLANKRYAVEHAQSVICVSHATRDALVDYYDIDDSRIRVIHNGVNPSFKPLPPDVCQASIDSLLPGDARDFILFVGSRQRYKNFHRLLRAYRSWDLNRDIDLVVVGSEPSPGDLQLDEVLPDDGRVHYLNAVTDQDLCALYQAARFFVYPSLEEGFGIPLLEAMRSGGHVCASDIPPFREVAGEAACYFDPCSIDDMHAAFARALDATVRQQCAEAAKSLPSFSWDQCAEGHWQMYQELAQQI